MTNDDRTDTVVAALEKIREEPALGDFAIPLPKLAEASSKDLGRTFQRLGELIGASEEEATLQFRIAGEGEARIWSLTTGPAGCNVTTEHAPRPDIEVLLDADTWKLIAEGTMSPLEAFGRGKARLRGDVGLARRIVRRLQHSAERAAP
jgi:putative sterol carrier protein